MNDIALSPQSSQRGEENEIAKAVLDAAFQIHSELGHGLLESVYEVVLARALAQAGLPVERQKAIPIRYHEMRFDEGFHADLIVGGLVLVEIKSIQALAPIHAKQVLTYLRLSDFRLGLLLNFAEASLKNGIKRIVNGLPSFSRTPLLMTGFARSSPGRGNFFNPLRTSRPLRERISP